MSHLESDGHFLQSRALQDFGSLHLLKPGPWNNLVFLWRPVDVDVRFIGAELPAGFVLWWKQSFGCSAQISSGRRAEQSIIGSFGFKPSLSRSLIIDRLRQRWVQKKKKTFDGCQYLGRVCFMAKIIACHKPNTPLTYLVVRAHFGMCARLGSPIPAGVGWMSAACCTTYIIPPEDSHAWTSKVCRQATMTSRRIVLVDKISFLAPENKQHWFLPWSRN